MALSRRSPFLVVPLACAVAAVLILPPRRAEDAFRSRAFFSQLLWEFGFGGIWYSTRPSSGFANSIARAGRSLDGRIGRIMFEDTLRAMLATSRVLRSSTEPLIIAWPTAYSADTAAALLRVAERELSTFPRDPAQRGEPVAILLSAEAHAEGHHEIVRRLVLNGGPARCVVVLHLGDAPREKLDGLLHDNATGRWGSFIDWCGLYARYGIPGASARNLVPRGGHGDYAEHFFLANLFSGTLQTERFRGDDFTAMACREGSTTDCEHVARHGVARWSRFGHLKLIADLVRRNPAAFGESWRTTEPFWPTVERAYGQSLAEIGREWVMRQQFDVKEVAPTPRWREVATLAAWIALLVAVAAMTRRREGKRGWSFSLSG